MSLAELLLPTYRHMLTALAAWLRKARDETTDADALMAARLHADMFPLATQIRFACVQAGEAVYRLQHAPTPPALDVLLNEGRAGGDAPGTIAAALARIDETLALIARVDGSVEDKDRINDGASKPLALDLPMGIAFDLDGEQYARDWALPQFYFHVMAAYAILRSRGVAIGKADYVAHMFNYLRPDEPGQA